MCGARLAVCEPVRGAEFFGISPIHQELRQFRDLTSEDPDPGRPRTILAPLEDVVANAAYEDEETPRRLGRYELIRRVAVGGMAEIFLARSAGLEGFEKLVVLKKILPQYAAVP